MRYIRARSYDRWLGTKEDVARLIEIASSEMVLEDQQSSVAQADNIAAQALEGVPKSARALVELLLEERARRSTVSSRLALEVLNSRTKLRVSGDPAHVLNHISPDEISEMTLTGRDPLLEREIEIRFDEHGVHSMVSSPDRDWVNARDSELRDALKKSSAGLRTLMSLLVCVILTSFVAGVIYKVTALFWGIFSDAIKNAPPGAYSIQQSSSEYLGEVLSRMSQPVVVVATVAFSLLAGFSLWDVAKRIFRSFSPGFRVVATSRPQPPRQLVNALGATLLTIPSALIVWWLTKQ